MTIRALFGFTAAIALSAASLHAQTYTEVGDAGQTVGTAQSTTGSGTLTTIFGNIASATDADLFRITITAPTTFSASTNNPFTDKNFMGPDTQLFLFTSSGVPIYTNNDANGTTVTSTLPAGTTFTMSLSPGVYLLGISLFGYDPINLNAQLLFAADGGQTTTVRGPASGINPNTLSNFSGSGDPNFIGAYQIDLTSSAAVPEPSTFVLATGGAVGLLAWLRRRAARASV